MQGIYVRHYSVGLLPMCCYFKKRLISTVNVWFHRFQWILETRAHFPPHPSHIFLVVSNQRAMFLKGLFPSIGTFFIYIFLYHIFDICCSHSAHTLFHFCKIKQKVLVSHAGTNFSIKSFKGLRVIRRKCLSSEDVHGTRSETSSVHLSSFVNGHALLNLIASEACLTRSRFEKDFIPICGRIPWLVEWVLLPPTVVCGFGNFI